MLEARGISFAYTGRESLFKGFDLSVAPGECVALSAPSGFGKTTLCRILAGYLQPPEGEVLADGAPLPKKGVCPVQLIGQHPEQVLDPRMRMEASLAEAQVFSKERNGLHGAVASGDSRNEEADAGDGILQALGIRREWLRRFPHELSGGEMQRFCIARALAANPSYLIADEMTTMLDAVSQAQVWAAVSAMAEERGMGILLVTHSPALQARLATRVVTLER